MQRTTPVFSVKNSAIPGREKEIIQHIACASSLEYLIDSC